MRVGLRGDDSLASAETTCQAIGQGVAVCLLVTRLLLQSVCGSMVSTAVTLHCSRPKHFCRESGVSAAYSLEHAAYVPKENLDVEHKYADRFLSHDRH